MKLAKVENPAPTEEKDTKDTLKPERPRTLKQALAQQQMPGRQMQQDGGVHRTKLVPSLDVKATPFGAYDAAIFAAIQQYWNDELDSHHYAGERTGRVTISFNLHFDGKVSDVQTSNNEVGILLGSFCQEAIEQTAPYEKWPSDMMHKIGSTQRAITITFIYY